MSDIWPFNVRYKTKHGKISGLGLFLYWPIRTWHNYSLTLAQKLSLPIKTIYLRVLLNTTINFFLYLWCPHGTRKPHVVADLHCWHTGLGPLLPPLCPHTYCTPCPASNGRASALPRGRSRDRFPARAYWMQRSNLTRKYMFPSDRRSQTVRAWLVLVGNPNYCCVWPNLVPDLPTW